MADLDRLDTDERADLNSYDLPPSDKIEATRTEIEQTRGDMAETLNAIKEKLDPKALMEEAKVKVGEISSDLADKAKDTVHTVVTDVADHAKEAAHNAVTGAVDEAKDVVSNVVHAAQDKVGGAMDTAKGAGSSVVEMIKGNPIPSALIALGAAWLYMKKRDDDSASRYGRYRHGEYGYDTGFTGRQNESASFVDKGKEKFGQAADAVGDAANAVKDRAGDMFDGAKDMGINIIETIERNPIPAAATALGIAWLVLKNQDENKARRYERGSYGYDEWNDRSSSGARSDNGRGNVVDQVKDKAGQVGDALGGAVDSVKEKAGHVGDAVGDAMGTVKEKAGQVTSQARQRAGELRSQAGGTFSRALQENPLPVGMVALGIGAAIGLLIPESEQEHRFMGETRDRLMEQAQGTAQDLTDKVKSVAGQAMDAAKETAQHVARDQGLTPDSNRAAGSPGPTFDSNGVAWSQGQTSIDNGIEGGL